MECNPVSGLTTNDPRKNEIVELGVGEYDSVSFKFRRSGEKIYYGKGNSRIIVGGLGRFLPVEWGACTVNGNGQGRWPAGRELHFFVDFRSG